MKKIFFTIIIIANSLISFAQNYTSGALGLYGPQYNAATTIASGGTVLVGNSGNWFLAGNITSADKGSTSSPTATGRSESILFSGTGTYSGATTTSGSSGNIIDGYASVTGQSSTFTLPIGTGGKAYPVSVPASQNVTAAYFSGSGSNSIQYVGDPYNPVTIFTPFIDFNNSSSSTGIFSFGYPTGVSSTGHDYLIANSVSTTDNSSETGFTQLASLGALIYTGGPGTVTTTSITIPSGISRIAFATSIGVLPLSINYFTAVVEGKVVKLDWETLTETNNKSFSVERSSDGIHFSEIAFVDSKAINGNSNAAISYAAIDNNPIIGNNYYRLKMVNLDGDFSYSKVEIIKLSASESSILIYPSPAKNQLTLDGMKDVAQVMFYNMEGRLMAIEAIAGADKKIIEVSDFSAGTYVVSFIAHDGKMLAERKFVKVK
ncbi:MAG TPA: T9SS type A sorting domain-containing protein [Puia sp.]|nr:T9SS type A sorting domain-containing protein [Puia sp.]